METETGKASELPYDVDNDFAMQQPEVAKRVEASIKSLTVASDKFLNSFIKSKDKIPYVFFSFFSFLWFLQSPVNGKKDCFNFYFLCIKENLLHNEEGLGISLGIISSVFVLVIFFVEVGFSLFVFWSVCFSIKFNNLIILRFLFVSSFVCTVVSHKMTIL